MSAPSSLAARWLRFKAVGAAGFLLQMASLWLLGEQGGLPYLVAATLSLELAILHNFVLHARWTWPDRPSAVPRLRQLARFNALHSATAMLHLACMAVLVETAGVSYLAANVVSVAACSLMNFCLAHTVVFVPAPPP